MPPRPIAPMRRPPPIAEGDLLARLEPGGGSRPPSAGERYSLVMLAPGGRSNGRRTAEQPRGPLVAERPAAVAFPKIEEANAVQDRWRRRCRREYTDGLRVHP